MRPRPSLMRVLRNDYGASLGVLLPLVAWAIYVAMLIFSPGDESNFLYVAGIMTLMGLILLVWRVSLINEVFINGVEAEATINGVSFFRGRGRVEYIYIHQGNKYSSGNAVQRTKATKAFGVRDKVTVLLEPSRPKRAFIRDLYR